MQSDSVRSNERAGERQKARKEGRGTQTKHQHTDSRYIQPFFTHPLLPLPLLLLQYYYYSYYQVVLSHLHGPPLRPPPRQLNSITPPPAISHHTTRGPTRQDVPLGSCCLSLLLFSLLPHLARPPAVQQTPYCKNRPDCHLLHPVHCSHLLYLDSLPLPCSTHPHQLSCCSGHPYAEQVKPLLHPAIHPSCPP